MIVNEKGPSAKEHAIARAEAYWESSPRTSVYPEEIGPKTEKGRE